MEVKKISEILFLNLFSNSILFILSGRVRGINVLFILVIQGCYSASAAVYLYGILNFVSLINKFLASKDKWDGN